MMHAIFRTLYQRILKVYGKNMGAVYHPDYLHPDYISPKGFSVEPLGRAGLIYREANREMYIESELLVGPSAIEIYTHSISRWKPPHDSELVTKEERIRIIENIREIYRNLGHDIDTVP